MRSIAGLIATVPHKFGLAAHCATLTDRAAFLGSVNVARRNPDGTWHGDQVDGAAFVAGGPRGRRRSARAPALQVGAGGAGSAIALALLEAGVAELALHDADPPGATPWSAGCGSASATASPSAPPTPPASTSSPTRPRWACARATRSPWTSPRLKPDTFVGDVVTKPAVPPLVEAARRIGCGTSTGSDMFAAVTDLIVDFLLDEESLKGAGAGASVDVAVVGSGAAGLVAACRAADGGRSVVVLEKADLLGGTSAVSGGVMWMPNHHLMGEQFPDSAEAALAYLTAATGGRVPHERLRWYVDTAREAVRWLDDETLVRLAAAAPPRLPHRLAGRRARPRAGQPAVRRRQVPGAHGPDPATDLLPDDHDGRARRHGRHGHRHRPRRPPRRRGHPDDGRRAGRRARGLGGGAGVQIIAGLGVDDLRRTPTGGWTLAGPCAARAVVLASGGFEWNPRLQEAFLPNPVTPISAPSNTGDGLELGLAAGAAVATMRAVWGVPVLSRTPTTSTTDARPAGWRTSS